MPEQMDSKPKQTVEQRLADLELQLAQSRAGTPGSTIPEHGAGYGDENEETWSQWEQEQARLDANMPPPPGRP